MTDPLRSLKYLPWRSLFQVAALTILMVAILEFILNLAFQQSTITRNIINILFSPPLDLLINFFMAVGVGALAVYLLERFYPQIPISRKSLWALIGCLILLLWVKVLLIGAIVLDLNEMHAIGMIVGIFWKGKPYWRY